ncbi:hypothetical protein HMPREF9069_00240 [Atopobium sp. oral taxon 810 str. F0209]|nr:hypothetical protein HMPREF9069_00240 [Atopobium sp. oral taxon 810 str. F0209]
MRYQAHNVAAQMEKSYKMTYVFKVLFCFAQTICKNKKYR